MTFSGNSRGISLTDVLQNIAGNQATGTLQVKGRQGDRYLRIENGAIAGFSMGQGKGLPIVERLCRMGYVEEKAVQRLLNRKKRSRKAASALLVEAKLIGEEDLKAAVSEQIEECIFDLLQIKDAEFSFTEGAPPSRVFGIEQRQLGLKLLIGPILMEAARRNDEWQRISKIVTSERDLFVLLEGWEEFELESLQSEITPYLDGRTDIGDLMGLVRASRFDLMKAISDLCHLGVARPSTADEIESAAREAMEAGNGTEAVRLLQQALTIERSNRALREELAVLLIELGRNKDAAAEFATLGFLADQDEDHPQALKHYDHAAVLNPEDLPLQEQRLEIVRKVGDRERVVEVALELTDLYSRMGLADRGRELLQTCLGDKVLQSRSELLVKLAELELSVGHGKESAKIFLRLADKTLAKDEAQGLIYLRAAQEGVPDDESLGERIESIESGREGRRRRRRRRMATLAASAAVFLAIGSAGVMEYMASRHLLEAMDGSLGGMDDPEAVQALSDLQEMSPQIAWTPSGRRADRLLERLVDRKLVKVDEYLSSGQYQSALDLVTDLQEQLQRPDLREACEQMIARVKFEHAAWETLNRAERYGDRFSEDFDMLAAMTDGRYLEFHCRQLPKIQNLQARRAVLRALLHMDNPRSFAVVALRMLNETDKDCLRLERKILASASIHRQQGRSGDWEQIFAELELALLQPSSKERAEEILGLLRD